MVSNPARKPTRIFLDTSVRFAAAHSETGFARNLILAGVRGELALVLSAYVIGETRRNLIAKASHALPFVDELLALERLLVIDPPPRLIRQVAIDIALKDAPIVAGARHAGAKFVATYDRKHLLSQATLIQARFGIIVGTPEFVLGSV